MILDQTRASRRNHFPRGGTRAIGIAGRPTTIVTRDDDDPDAEGSQESHGGGIVAERGVGTTLDAPGVYSARSDGVECPVP